MDLFEGQSIPLLDNFHSKTKTDIKNNKGWKDKI